MQSGEYFKAINVTASSSIDRNWKDIFAVSCSSGSGTTNPRYTGLNATALINLELSATIPQNITQGLRIIEIFISHVLKCLSITQPNAL